MPLLTKNQLLLAKTETTKGTDASPTAAANAVLSDIVDVTFDISKIASPEVRRSISASEERPGFRKVNFTIKTAVKGSGEAGTAPEISPLLQACGLKETISENNVSYAPVSGESDKKNTTIYFYFDGRLIKGLGCVGNASVQLNPGEIGIITFEMQGTLAFNGDSTLPNSQEYQEVTAPIVELSGLTFGSFENAVVPSFTLETGNEIIDRMDINSAYGHHSSTIASRDPRWGANVEATTEAVKSWWGNFNGRVKEAISLHVGSESGNKVEITIPKAVLNDGVVPTDNNGIVNFNLSGQALEDEGDDNFTLTFK